MATATTKKNWTKSNLKKEYGKIHDRVLNISEETVETTVDNIEKWQKLFAKSLTASTPLVERGIDISFDVAETIAEQYKNGGQRLKTLLGLGSSTFINEKKIKATKAKAIKAVKKQVQTVTTELNELKDQAENIKDDLFNTAAPQKSKKVTGKKQKLTDINGIGPKIAGLLNAAGINEIKDLAEAEMKTLEGVLDAAGPRFQMHDPSTWVKQAKELIG